MFSSMFEVVRYSPARRAGLVGLLARVGTTQLSEEEFRWWFERNPAGEGIVSLVIAEDDVVGVAAMSYFRTALDGTVTRLAVPVNVATDPRFQGRGIFSALERENEEAAAQSGSPLGVTFPNGVSYPIFVGRLGWSALPRLRLWARPLRAGGVLRYLLGRRGEQSGVPARDSTARTLRGLEVRPIERFEEDFDDLGTRAASAYGHHFVRDAGYLNWRYLDSPRDYRCFGAYRDGRLAGAGIVGHTFKHGVSAGFLADLVAAPEDGEATRALVERAVDEVRGAADAVVVLPPPSGAQRRALVRAGFLPTTKTLRFVGKALAPSAQLDERRGAWHFTLGDFDFF